MANSLPEVKREKWPPELPPLSGFLLFFVTCHATSRNMYIFNPGDSHMKGAGMLVEEDQHGRGPTFFDP